MELIRLEDTIAAIASAPGSAPRGIVRLSGPAVVTCLASCFQSESLQPLDQYSGPVVIGGRLRLPPPIGDLPVDLYWWPTDRSYTRQPSAEIHTFGSPPLLEAVLQAVCAAGARLAGPGEFTLRAFLAGRLDLTQAEAVLGVVDAESRQELDVALTQLAGGLASALNSLRDTLADLLADLEAGLDFAEEPIEFVTARQLEGRLSSATDQVAHLADQISSRARAGDEFRVVLIGWPNVGKSSLMNALAGDRTALVSPAAGTTRDYLTRSLELEGGVRCLLVDTAGVTIDATQDPVSAAAEEMRSQQSSRAHLRLLCIDATRRLNGWERAATERVDPRTLIVLTKTDAARGAELDLTAIETSSKTGRGLSQLLAAIRQQITQLNPGGGDVVGATAVRCRESLRLAADGLDRARRITRQGQGEELVAAELRTALYELGKVVGAVYTEDLLDRIFSRFCIGK